MPPKLLRSMAQDALPFPQDSSCEQTIIASAVKIGGELFPEKLSLVEFDDVFRFRTRNMKTEGYYSRHYVHWMRHVLYRDAVRLRFHCFRRPYSKGNSNRESRVELARVRSSAGGQNE
jgi:hypothetical protein